MNNPIRRTRPEKTGVSAPLGDLEQQVMRCVWDCKDEGIVSGVVLAAIERDHPIALTTVLTTLDRLREKGIVRRERDGKAFRYWAAIAEDALQQRIVGGVLDRLIAQFPSAVAAYFAQQDTPLPTAEENATLSELAQRIEQIQDQSKSENPDGH